ncbi:MAG TPA: response regulator, partial [Gemmataceae bacterium]|nr:response regulator [Gemmataceae bacterium]
MVSLRVENTRSKSNGFTATQEEPAALEQAPEKNSDELFCAGEVRILIVDDDPSVGRVIQSALARRDFFVDAVSDPAQMEAKIQERPYHIVILDYVIPGLESEKVLGWVREHQPEA